MKNAPQALLGRPSYLKPETANTNYSFMNKYSEKDILTQQPHPFQAEQEEKEKQIIFKV